MSLSADENVGKNSCGGATTTSLSPETMKKKKRRFWNLGSYKKYSDGAFPPTVPSCHKAQGGDVSWPTHRGIRRAPDILVPRVALLVLLRPVASRVGIVPRSVACAGRGDGMQQHVISSPAQMAILLKSAAGDQQQQVQYSFGDSTRPGPSCMESSPSCARMSRTVEMQKRRMERAARRFCRTHVWDKLLQPLARIWPAQSCIVGALAKIRVIDATREWRRAELAHVQDLCSRGGVRRAEERKRGWRQVQGMRVGTARGCVARALDTSMSRSKARDLALDAAHVARAEDAMDVLEVESWVGGSECEDEGAEEDVLEGLRLEVIEGQGGVDEGDEDGVGSTAAHERRGGGGASLGSNECTLPSETDRGVGALNGESERTCGRWGTGELARACGDRSWWCHSAQGGERTQLVVGVYSTAHCSRATEVVACARGVEEGDKDRG
ncbi:hypothetical protein B0H11DRAFT_1943360 [Mycena galericulata]|nr:hypothetical protein B0H11DRAFT_1943360 [Mycena galericulata]